LLQVLQVLQLVPQQVLGLQELRLEQMVALEPLPLEPEQLVGTHQLR
jgi:hypothetical protein